MSQYQEGLEVAGRFVIQERIGEGGMGAVYRAMQTSLDREVALKVLHAQNEFTARARRRFAREARAIARLNHPHIAGVYDFGVDEGAQTLWLAMELVEGESLIGLKHDPLDIMRLLVSADQILSALSAAHARGIIHRDLKPSNVLVGRDDEGRDGIKLVDFGLAATREGELGLEGAPIEGLDEESEGDRVIFGTPRYMAPEIFRRAPVDPKVDLYALGVMLFEIIAGTPPYPGDDPREVMRGHIKEPIPRLHARDGQSVPVEFERAIYTLLAKDPEERYQSAAQVREVLARIVSEFSYVPWMAMAPRQDANSFHLSSNASQVGFVSNFGGTTIPPASIAMNQSKPGLQAGFIAPLVGRAAERRALEAALRAALQEQRGSLVLIDGEAGVGKTRLIQWLRVRVEETGVMQVACGAYSRAMGGFHGVREALSALLDVDAYDHDELTSSLTHRLSPLGLTGAEIELCVRLLRPDDQVQEMLDAGASTSAGSNLSAQERVFATIERVLRAVAQRRPLLLLLEDLHDAGELTMGFLEHLAVGLHLSPAPIVLLATMRADEIAQAPRLREALDRLTRFGSRDVTSLTIKRLNQKESSQLVRKLVPLPDTLSAEISERAAGNPLHVVQIIRFLQDSAKLVYDNGQWVLAEGVELAREIPDEVADMMRYRIARTCQSASDPGATRAILDRAAVLGRRFDYGLLHTMLVGEPGAPWRGELDVVLESLIRQGIFREVGQSGEDRLEFEHTMMRDVLLQELRSKRSTRSLHRLAAEAKIATWGERAAERAIEIAQHYQRAKHPPGVYRHTLIAARHALASCDLKAAMSLFRRAEEVAELASGGSTVGDMIGLEEVSSLIRGDQVALEVAHLERRLGEYESARHDYRKLLSSEMGEVALWSRWGLGDLSVRQGDFDDANGWFEAARREALRVMQFPSTEIRQPVAALVDAYALFGTGSVMLSRGDLGAAAITLGEALDRARGCEEHLLETEVLRALSDVCWRRGDADRAELYRRRATLIVERFGDVEERALSALHQATSMRAMGYPSEAAERAEQALAAFEELGKRHYVAHCLLLLGQIAWGRGDNKEAAQRYRKAHRFYEMFRDRRGLTEAKLYLAELAFSIKRYPDTQTLVRDALEGVRAMGDRRGEARCWLLVGRLEREMGRRDKAARTFAEAARMLSELGDLRLAIVANLYRALVAEETEQDQEADAILRDLTPVIEDNLTPQESAASALSMIARVTSSRRPDVAATYELLSQRVWTEMGRPVEVAS